MIEAANGYHITAFRSYATQLGRIFAAWTTVFAFFALVLFFLKLGDTYSRVWFMAWYVGELIFFVCSRAVLGAMVRHWADDGRLERRAVIVGDGQPVAELIMELESQSDNDIHICGIFDDRSPPSLPDIPSSAPSRSW